MYTLSKNNLNLRIKTEPVTDGANATLYSHVWFLGQIYVTVASAPAVTDSVLLHRFRLFLTRCTQRHVRMQYKDTQGTGFNSHPQSCFPRGLHAHHTLHFPFAYINKTWMAINSGFGSCNIKNRDTQKVQIETYPITTENTWLPFILQTKTAMLALYVFLLVDFC